MATGRELCRLAERELKGWRELVLRPRSGAGGRRVDGMGGSVRLWLRGAGATEAGELTTLEDGVGHGKTRQRERMFDGGNPPPGPGTSRWTDERRRADGGRCGRFGGWRERVVDCSSVPCRLSREEDVCACTAALRTGSTLREAEKGRVAEGERTEGERARKREGGEAEGRAGWRERERVCECVRVFGL